MKKKILVCGSRGFIGRNVAEFLAVNNDLDVYGTYYKSKPCDNKNIKFLYADLTNMNDVNKVVKDTDIIIQAAATTSGIKDIVARPYYHVTDNAVMNSLIFRSAHEHKVAHVVFFSCTVMYQSCDEPVKETDFDAMKEMHLNYFGVGWTKVYLEKMCEFYSRIGKAKYTVVRHSNIYGPYDKFDLERSHVFGATVAKVMTALEGDEITVWGNGGEERDLLYVSDLVNFVDIALTKQTSKFELYNVGYGKSIAISDLVRKIIECSGKKLEIKYDLSKPSIKTKVSLDIARAKSSLGWSPKFSLDEGIKKTMEWYRRNKCQK
jgi:GDP-L-fucose synthase